MSMKMYLPSPKIFLFITNCFCSLDVLESYIPISVIEKKNEKIILGSESWAMLNI